MSQFIVDRLSFLSALETASKVVASVSYRPILQSVRLSVDHGFLSVSGTDLETAIGAELSCQTADGASLAALLPLAQALKFAKASEASHVTIEHVRNAIESRPAMRDSAGKVEAPEIPAKPGLVRLSTNDGESIELDTEPLEEYPVLPTIADSDVSVVLKGARLRKALERVLPAVAKGAGRYATHGVLIELQARAAGYVLALIGTDGRRLAMETLDGIDVPISADPFVGTKLLQFILPRETAVMLSRMLPKKEERFVSVRFCTNGEGRPSFSFATNELLSVRILPRALDGEFPRYSAIIPARHDSSIVVNSEELLRRLKVVRVSCADDAPCVLLQPAEDVGFATKLVAKAPGRKSSVELKTATVSHDPSGRAKNEPKGIEPLGLNPDYLADGVKACDSEDVTIAWTRKKNPLTIRAGSFVYVQMPITFE